MIPGKYLQILIDYSIEDEDGNMVLDVEKAPKKVIELAKKFSWRPFNVTEDEDGFEIETIL